MVRFLIAFIVAFWICAIALIAAQNGTRVSLQFLGMQTIEIPLGIMLAFSAAIGMLAAAVVSPLLGAGRSSRASRDREDFEQ
jgi:uncharacterized integral membrane protein